MPVKQMDYTPIISLCHFCEIHGPSTVFSTQSFIESPTTPTAPYDQSCPQTGYDSASNIVNVTTNDSIPTGDVTSENSPQLQALFLGLRQLRIDCSGSTGGSEFVNEKDHKICEGCSLTPKSLIIKKYNRDGASQDDNHIYKGYISNDQTLRRKYITANEPLCYRNLIKQACIRSLSCETYPQENEGAIYFGDDIRWHNLSWLFVLKDSRARGFNRTYSIVISHPTKGHLMSSWKFYNRHMSSIIENLKQKSAQTFKREIATMDCKQQRWSIRLDRVSQYGYPSNMNSNLMNRVARYVNQLGPTTAQRIQQPAISNVEDSFDERSLSDMDSVHGTSGRIKDRTSTSSSGISSGSGMKTIANSDLSQTSGMSAFARHRDPSNTQRGNSEARSLIDLTADELIFANLHLFFSHILKLTNERFMQSSPQYEVGRLSSPSYAILNNRDHQNQENSTREQTENRAISRQQQPEDGASPIEAQPSNSLSRSSQIIQLDRIKLGDNRDIWEDAKYFTSLRHMYMFLGRDKFKIIGYHTIIGSRIVITCKYRDLLCEFMRCLAILLPTERTILQADVPNKQDHPSLDCWRVNIIGFIGTKLPNSILESNYQLLIDISDRNLVISSLAHEEQEGRRPESPLPARTLLKNTVSSISAKEFRITLHSKERLPGKLPQFLTNLIEIIRNIFYSDHCLERYLIATKEEWLTSAKMVWAITRANPSRETSDLSQIYPLFNIEDCDRKLIQYWADADQTFKMNTLKLA